MHIAASAERIWEDLACHEGRAIRPPVYLRLLWPGPTARERVVRLYVSGTLVKRVQQLDRRRRCELTVVAGNPGPARTKVVSTPETYRGAPADVGTLTALTITSRYVTLGKPRWLLRPIETAVCYLFHRHVLQSIRRRVIDA